jgi:hypothetical protein
MTPTQLKDLKIGGAILAGGLLLYLLFGNKKDNTGVYTNTEPNGGYSPGPTFNALSVADDLHEAMNQFGTDESGILELLKTVTPAQFAQVVTAFGGRKYNSFTGNDYGFGLDSLSLKKWLKYELSISDYAILRSKYPNSL